MVFSANTLRGGGTWQHRKAMNRRDEELAAHHPWLRRMARRLARSKARAEDLVQDTYVTALRKAPPDVQLRPWLRAVMHKLAWGQVRSETRRTQREEGFSLTAPALTMPDAFLGHGIARERLIAALTRLPEPFHSTLVQRFLRGRSCADIARSENVPAGTVRWRQARGLELLRAELVPGRRRQHAIWGLPFVGAGQRLVARAWQTLAARGSTGKAIWLWLACAAMIYAISHSDEAVRGPAVRGIAHANPRDAASAVHAPAGSAEASAEAGGDRPGAVLAGGPAPTASAAPPWFADVASEGSRRVPYDDALAAFDGALDSHRDGCRWDPVNAWRCAEAPSSSAPPEDGRCVLIRRQILAGEVLALGSPTARRTLTAAMRANRALARRLGCPAMRGDDVDDQAGAGGGGKAGCVTQTGEDGNPCTVCPGQRPVCAPADCHSRMRSDGIVCTSCIDAHGETHSDCPEDPPSACHSEVTDAGFLCSSCDDQLGPPECMPAACMVIDRCLRCVDPKGRVGIDCSTDYGVSGGAGYGLSAVGVFFSSCEFSWGVAGVSGTTCHYPGLQTCTVSQADDWQCLECGYPDGSGGGLCNAASEPLPDPLADRPLDLPPPGTCASELDNDGRVLCATCTREDLSATTSCRYPGIESCDLTDGGPDGNCLAECRRVDGSRVRVCNTPRGPRPSEAQASTGAHITPTRASATAPSR
jgi:RNA polymerase sigma-70 factor (ECF subfamily)